MGIPVEEFDEPAGRLDFLLCSSCKDVVDAPNFVCEAEHLACTSCLERVVTTRLIACPAADIVCTAKWNLRNSGFVQRQLDLLKRRCPFRRYGCPYTGLCASLEEHRDECGFIAQRCECGHHILKKDYAQHRKITCPEAPMICERKGYGCPATFKRKEKAAHDAACQRYRCNYVTQGCQSYGTKATILKHETTYCAALHTRLQTLETASTNSKGELDDCRQTIRMLKESNVKLQSEVNEAREKAADADAQRQIMASASQQSQSAKRKRPRSATTSPLKGKSTQESHDRKRTRPAASQRLAPDEGSGISSSSDFEMDQEDDRLVALQLVKEEDDGPNLYRQEIAQIKRQLVEKDVEIARLTEALQKLQADAKLQKEKLYERDADIEDLREQLQDKEEGLAHLRTMLDVRSAANVAVKAEDTDDALLNDNQVSGDVVEDSLSPYGSGTGSLVGDEDKVQQEEEEDDDEDGDEDKAEDFEGDRDEDTSQSSGKRKRGRPKGTFGRKRRDRERLLASDLPAPVPSNGRPTSNTTVMRALEDDAVLESQAASSITEEEEHGSNEKPTVRELSETPSTDEPTPPPPHLPSSSSSASSPHQAEAGTSKAGQFQSRPSLPEPRPRIWRASEQQHDKLSQPQSQQIRALAASKPSAATASSQAVKKEPQSTNARKSIPGLISLSSSEESDEELPTVEELFRSASQRPLNSQRPSVFNSPGKGR